PIEIRQGQDTVKQLSLVAGENKVTLRSGSYEIVLPAKYDSLKVESGKFELSRGGECVAKISESVRAAAQPENVEFKKGEPNLRDANLRDANRGYGVASWNSCGAIGYTGSRSNYF
ncbi:MAG: hypothetical protein O2856_12140, partial [Planctomycetota bacterium]|nr:hypothetical protein [Planctomycetota bacterium]